VVTTIDTLDAVDCAPFEPAHESTLTAESAMSRWRETLAPYTEPRVARSAGQVLTSVAAYLALATLTYFSISISPLLALALAVPTAGFLLRTYIVFHDCAHGSFLPWRRANEWLGTFCALLVLVPFVRWRHDHAVHHATAGDLDRRGVGDLPTLTVAEYDAKDWRGRLGYRLFRNPLVMFGLGPIFAMIIGPRIFTSKQRPRMRNSVIVTDIAIVGVIGTMIALLGIGDFLLMWAPAALLAGSVGIWLFYVQHQFEDMYWERGGDWSYADAALRGSSYLKLPKVLQFFTGNIGLHHVHHMSARIPNYNLQRAHDAIPAFHGVPTLSLWQGLLAARLKLWDEDGGRMVTWAQARACRAAA
jgi:omega-6 fatty acid desaturase (delta-12 desaturase)